MRLLVFTQKVDKSDPVLGFFHTWILELSKKTDSIEVICLEKGEFDLPKNVTVYSLGKERGVTKVGYIVNLYKYLYLIRGSYDKVFVHMNQEYILLAGLYWKIKGVPVFMWRNHPVGSLVTRVAVLLSEKVFCTSNKSFTARFDKTRIMPAGIDMQLYKPVPGVVRKKYSVCMFGRISPIKHQELAIESIQQLVTSGIQVSLDIIGPVAEKDIEYFEKIKKYVEENNLSNTVHFLPGLSPDKVPEMYTSYEICLNLTPSGSFDKTIVESASCGAIPLVINESLKVMLPDSCIAQNSKESIAGAIRNLLDPAEQVRIQKKLDEFVDSQSLTRLVKRIFEEID